MVQQINLICDYTCGINTMLKNLNTYDECENHARHYHDKVERDPQDFIVTVLNEF